MPTATKFRARRSAYHSLLGPEEYLTGRRFELLASDVRNQIGKIDRRLLSTENGGATHLGAVDALQLQVSFPCGAYELCEWTTSKTSAAHSTAYNKEDTILFWDLDVP